MSVIRNSVILFLLGLSQLRGQNPVPTNTILNSQLPNNVVDSYTRAAVSISLEPGFKYGFVSGGATNLLNLNISINPTFVGSGYIGSGVNPGPFNCGPINPDPSKPVGETKGSFAVGPSGAAIYNIPIVVSPGTQGIQPELSVNYVSQQGFSTLGTKWNLTGISSISRSNKTVYGDGITDGINLSYTDVFSIDGVKLYSNSLQYGQNGIVYYKEFQDFSVITSFGQSGNGPEWFQVKEKTGRILEFGRTPDSRLTGIGNNSTVLRWMVNKVTDEFGNFMVFSYTQLNGECVISRIDYTGNANFLPYNSVTFNYIDLAEKSNYFVSGVEFRKTKLLKSISSFSGNDLVRKYVFDYEWNQRTLLAKITEVDSYGNELNPTLFCWEDEDELYGNAGSDTQNAPLFQNPGEYSNMTNSLPVDFNGDGFSDVLCFYTGTLSERYRVMKNNFKAAYGTLNNNVVNFSEIYNGVFNNTSQTCNNVTSPKINRYLSGNVGDINFDNKQEAYLCVTDDPDLCLNTVTKYKVFKLEQNQAGSIVQTTISTQTLANSYDINFLPSQFLYDINDYNGDGIQDQLRIDPENVTMVSNQIGTVNFPINTGSTIARPIEFDGDGIPEIILLEHQNNSVVNITVLKLNQNGAPFQYQNVYATSINFPFNFQFPRNMLQNIALGDFNGDGLTDLAYINATLDQLFVRYNNSQSLLAPQQVNEFTALTNNFSFIYNVKGVDINGDSKCDIIITDNQGNVNGPIDNYFSYYSEGSFFIKGPSYKGNFIFSTKNVLVPYTDNTGAIDYVKKQISYASGIQLYGDYNGDGVYDEASFNDATADKIINNSIFHPKPQVIFRINTPYRNDIRIAYGNIQREQWGANNLLYEALAPTPNANLNNLKPNIWVVGAYQVFDGDFQTSNTTNFQYKNAVTHPFGRGFLGFEQVVGLNTDILMTSITKTDFNNSFFVPLTNELDKGFNQAIPVNNGQSEFSINSASVTSKMIYQYSLVPINQKGCFTSLDQSISKDYLNTRQSTTTFAYDISQDGNIISENTSNGWGASIIMSTSKSYTYTYIQSTGIFKPQNTLITITQTGESPYSRQTDMAYDNLGHLSSTTNDPTFGAQSIISNYSQYNQFGLAKSVCISAGDITTRCNSVDYDPTGRFVVKKTNPIGDFEEMIYDPKYGSVIQNTSNNGLITLYKYDGLGRVIQSTLPSGVINKTTYAWDNLGNNFYYSSSLQNGLVIYSKKDEIGGQPYTKVYLSGSGKIHRAEKGGFNGSVIYRDMKYTSPNVIAEADPGVTALVPKGTLVEDTEPYYSNQTTFLVTHYNYTQFLNRKRRDIIFLVNNGTSTNQNLFKKLDYNSLSTDANPQKCFVMATDQLGRSAKKEYNAAGENDKVINNNVIQTETETVTYNSQLKPKEITLTNSGNPNQSIVHSFSYNNLGQQIQLNDPSNGITTYQYNSIGELLQQSDQIGTFNFTRDVLGRMLTKSGNQSGTYTYQYLTSGNGKGLIDKILGPNSVTEYKYDNLNRVTERKETINNTVIKTSTVFDNFGREIQYTYPNGFILNKQYDSQGFLVQIKNANNQMLWQLNDITATDETRQYTYGNGISTIANRDPFHHFTDITHGSLHQQIYDFDPSTGNLNSRRFNNFATSTNLYEQFTYDNLDRLTKTQQFTVNGQLLFPTANINNMSYDAIGNISHKDDAGNYVYNLPSKPYLLTSINNPAQNISLNTLNVQYTDFRKVSQISEMGTNKQMNFIYGPEYERIRVDYSINGNSQYTRYYGESFDRQETQSGYKEWDYIYGPGGLVAINYNNNGSSQLLYALTDHLGSPVLLTSNSQNPSIIEEYSFDAWGRRRNPGDWTYNNIPVPQYLNRGYTMHEMLDEFKLINMNGRVYDPVLGRFIQPDNYVQLPSVLQNFNRYSYCLNNPLKNTDPSGNEFILDDIAAIVVGGTSNVITNWSKIMNSQNSFLVGAEYFGAGAAGAEVGLYLGPVAGFAVGGALTAGVDAANGMYTKKELNGQSLYEAISESFVGGGLSALSGMEGASDAYEAKFGEEALKSGEISESFKSFYKFSTKTNPFIKSLYSGAKNVGINFAQNNYHGETNGDLGIRIIGNFAGGYVSSIGSSAFGEYGPPSVLKGPGYFVTKLPGTYLAGFLGHIIDVQINAGLHQEGLFHTNSSYWNPDYDFQRFPDEALTDSPDFGDAFILTVLKWK